MGYINQHLQDTVKTTQQMLENPSLSKEIQSIVDVLASCLQQGGKILTCGNGGSLCDSMHFAQELSGRFCLNRRPLGAFALSDSSHLTCVSNDYSYNLVFSRAVEALGREGDCLICFSTSGQSKNVLLAAEKALSQGMKVIALTGKGGGKLLPLSQQSIVIPSQSTSVIQENHVKLIHILIEGIERALFPELYTT